MDYIHIHIFTSYIHKTRVVDCKTRGSFAIGGLDGVRLLHVSCAFFSEKWDEVSIFCQFWICRLQASKNQFVYDSLRVLVNVYRLRRYILSYQYIPVVPHKAVAEVSRIGNV